MLETAFCLRNSFSIPSACRERFARLEQPGFAGMRRLGVALAGVSDLVPGYGIGNPRPTLAMLIATVGGRGAAVTPAGAFALEPGTLFVGPPGVPVGWAIEGARWRIVWWYLRPAVRWRAWCGDAAIHAPCPRAALLDALMRDALDRVEAGDGALAAATVELVARHLEDLAADPTAAAATGEDRFAALWREVAAEPQGDWSLPRLAARLGASLSTTQRLARAHLGAPAHRALVDLRLRRARELLRRTAYPIGAIAELVGYVDAFTFSSAYRRWAGRAPSADRGASRRDRP